MNGRVYFIVVIQLLLSGSPAEPRREKGYAFEVALIYEDLAAGKRGKCFCDMLSSSTQPGIITNYELCNFQMLKTQQGRDLTAIRAASADLVVLSTSSGKALPKAVKEWLEIWVSLTDPTGPALTAVFAKSTRATRTTCDYLRNLAASGCVEFFSYTLPANQKEKRISSRGRKGNEKAYAVRANKARADAGSTRKRTHEYIKSI
jgi:hypothetical protein